MFVGCGVGRTESGVAGRGPPYIAASPQALSNQLSAISYGSGMESSRAAKNLMDANSRATSLAMPR
jgi:hypothetical protein